MHLGALTRIAVITLVLAGGLLGLIALAGRPGVGPTVAIEVALKRIQELQSLTVLRVPVQFVHQARIDGYLGGVRCLLHVQGTVDLGVDLGQARLTDVDTASRTATLQLPRIHVVSSKVDFESTRIYRLDRRGLWLIVPGEAGAQQVLRQALSESESTVRRAGTEVDYQRRAKERARVICAELAERVGWRLN